MAEKAERTLAAIMFTDMVGYSALTQKNEALALELLEAHHALLRPLFPKYGGKEIKTIGDAFLVKFGSALDAARCAIEMQKTLVVRNATVASQKRIQIRIGIHVGDVVHQDADVFGDAVNIASRIEPLARPGGVCVSEDVARQIQNKIEEPLRRIGKSNLKNIQLPVEVYEIALPWMETEEALVASTAMELKAPRARMGWPQRIAWSLAGLLLGVLVAGIAIWNLRTPGPRPTTRFAITLPPNEALTNLDSPTVAVSPDEAHLAYVGSRGGSQQLFLRAFDSLEARPIEGTEGASIPFFSPDGQWLGFFAGNSLKKISIAGGASVTVVNVVGTARGASWGADDTIAFAGTAAVSGLSQVSAGGGASQPLTKTDPAKGEFSHRWPQFLPGGKAVLFTVQTARSTNNFDEASIAVQQLQTGERKVLVQGGTYGRYVPTGHLIYLRSETLMAAPFDLKRVELTGPAVPVVEGVMQASANGGAPLSISDQGSLVYIPGGTGGTARALVWVDRKGVEQPLGAPLRPYLNPRLSPDGRLLAVEAQADIWVYDIPRGTLSRLTFDGGSILPIWSPDGKRIAFSSAREEKPGNLFWKPADGSGPEERLSTSDHRQNPHSWSPDGQVIAITDTDPTTGVDLWVLPLSGERKPRLFLRTPFVEGGAKFSPDGRWLAYASNESGRNEIYVQPFPGPGGGKWQISTDGGREPLWGRNGELFYWNGNRLMAVETKTQPAFSAGAPRLLFEGLYERTGPGSANYDVAADSQRFVMVKASGQEAGPTQINVVLNWFEELKRRVPVP